MPSDEKWNSKAAVTLERVAPTSSAALQRLTTPEPIPESQDLARLRHTVEEYVPDETEIRVLSNGDTELRESAAATLALGSVLQIPIKSAVHLIQEQMRLHPDASKGEIYLRVLGVLRDKKPLGKKVGNLAAKLLKKEGL